MEETLGASWDQVRDDVTPNDIYNAGLSAGVHFSFFMLRNHIKKSLTDKDIVKLAHWFELKHEVVHDFQQWYNLMISALCLDEGGLNND